MSEDEVIDDEMIDLGDEGDFDDDDTIDLGEELGIKDEFELSFTTQKDQD